MKRFSVLIILCVLLQQASAQLVINELSQGPSGAQEYVELLVTGTPVCGGTNTVDLRGWIIDDNNSWHKAGSGNGIAGGHARFDSIAQWANVKIGSLILIYNDADTSPAVHALTVDVNDANQDGVYIVPISSAVIKKNVTLPVSNGSMTTYAVPGTTYSATGTWAILGMANGGDAFHTVSPANYAAPHHAIGWGSNNLLVNVYYNTSQTNKVIYMANTINNDPFNQNNFLDSLAITHETPGAPNNAANAAWIASLNNFNQPFTTPTLTVTQSGNLDCSNTIVTLTAASTTSGAVFNWSNGITVPTNTVTTPGTYYVTVTNASSVCSTTDSLTVTSSSTLLLDATATQATCGSYNGTASVSVTTGTATGYLWSNTETTSGIINLAPGTYTVTVTGNGGCSAVSSVTVGTTGTLSLSTTAVSTTCGNNNGQANVVATSGTAIGYLWSNGETTASLINLPAGTYTVTVDGGSGCTATATVVVNPSSNTPVTVTASNTIICSGDSAELCAPAGFIAYLWNTGESTDCIQAKLGGNYYITVTDGGNCTAVSAPVALTVRPQPSVSLSVNGDTMRAYNATAYQWYFNNGIIQGATDSVYIATQTGNYQVAITDTAGCKALSNVIPKTVGIEESILSSYIQVYPNPLQHGNWQIQTDQKLFGSKFEIFDCTGRLMYQSEIHEQNTEVYFTPAKGVYLLRVSLNQHQYSLKLVKL